MKEIFRGMLDAAEAINNNFKELQSEDRNQTVHDLIVTGEFALKNPQKIYKFEGKINDHNIEVRAERIGNICVLHMGGHEIHMNAWSGLDYYLPNGFKPIGEVVMLMRIDYEFANISIGPDGGMYNRSLNRQDGSPNDGIGMVTYLTNDSFPEELETKQN